MIPEIRCNLDLGFRESVFELFRIISWIVFRFGLKDDPRIHTK